MADFRTEPDVVESPEIVARYGVLSIPAIIIIVIRKL
jgi:hypothetical protein